MNLETIDNLIARIGMYNPNILDLFMIKKAYHFAVEKHSGQKRLSGGDYIEHPLAVAFILAGIYADADTICAALLHDVIEDTDVTKEEIEAKFNKTIAALVDGSTKISKMNFSSRDDSIIGNQKKILMAIEQDVRIIIIKLADRLHNTRTMDFQSEGKQKEKSIENFEIYIPMAYHLGIYSIKRELADLSFKYLKPEIFSSIKKDLEDVKRMADSTVKEMLGNLNNTLKSSGIPHSIEARIKSIYNVYKYVMAGKGLDEIHDLIALKVMTQNVKDCYYAMGLIHEQYHPLNGRIKDFIALPKTNLYQSLHTTVFGPNDRLIQCQIRTDEMHKVANSGITYHWFRNGETANMDMQKELKEKYQFFKSLMQLYNYSYNDIDFVVRAKEEILTNKIYVYTYKGEIIELPVGSTAVDFAYKISDNVGNKMEAVIINNSYASFDTELHNHDIVKIIINPYLDGPKMQWTNFAKTSLARRKIREFHEEK